jgi:hypothetical protein
LARNGGKSSAFINDPQRCEVCNTTLTLYPRDFTPCPHCQRSICRQCWGNAWASKSFSAEACSHFSASDTLRGSESIVRGTASPDLDWVKIGLAGAMILLALVTFLFLFNLFA